MDPSHLRQIIIDNENDGKLVFIKDPETITADNVQSASRLVIDASEGVSDDDEIFVKYATPSFRWLDVDKIGNLNIALIDRVEPKESIRPKQVDLSKQRAAAFENQVKDNPELAEAVRNSKVKNNQFKSLKTAANNYLDKEFEDINNETHDSMAKYLDVTEENDEMFVELPKDERKDIIDYLTKHRLYDLKEHYEFISPDASLNKTNIQKQAASGAYEAAKTQYADASAEVVAAVEEFKSKKGNLGYQIIKYPQGYKDPILALIYEDSSNSDYFHVSVSNSNLAYLNSHHAENLGVIRYDKLLMEKLKDKDWELATDDLLPDGTGKKISVIYRSRRLQESSRNVFDGVFK